MYLNQHVLIFKMYLISHEFDMYLLYVFNFFLLTRYLLFIYNSNFN